MEYKQFLAEFYLNLKYQGFEFGYGLTLIIFEIWYNYLYEVCPNLAILVDPIIVDTTRKLNMSKLIVKMPESKALYKI